MNSEVHATFDLGGIMLPLDAILPIRQVKAIDGAFGKYRAVLASIREVGVIEPLIVFPRPGEKRTYFLLDGHMRLKALRELGAKEAFCLIATEDDAFTYNDKVNRITVIQEHAMIMKAIDHGVKPEQIAKALAVDVAKITSQFNLLEGLHAEVIELLKDKPITATALRIFRKVKAVRQIDMAQLMVAGNNYTMGYAQALVLGTPAEQLVNGAKSKEVRGLSEEERIKMEKEMETVERDFRLCQDRFGENALHLNGAQRYVKRLLDNTKIGRFLTNRYPEILDEFQDIVALDTL